MSTCGAKWQEIGHGNFSRVFKVLKRVDGCLYAIKRSLHRLQMTSERFHFVSFISSCIALERQLIFVGGRTPSLLFLLCGCPIIRSRELVLVPLWAVLKFSSMQTFLDFRMVNRSS